METPRLILTNVQQECNLAVGIVVENEFQHTVLLLGEIGGQPVDKFGMNSFVGGHQRGFLQRNHLHLTLPFASPVGGSGTAPTRVLRRG